jgi:RimJ/RimL family protein N-acetyltransferase
VIETARLALREMGEADLDSVAAMLGDPEVMRHYPGTLSREQAAQWIRRQRERYARDGHGLWLVEATGVGVVGQVGLIVQEVCGKAEAEIGYMIHRPYWRRGYAVEAGTAVRDRALGLMRLPRVIALVRAENVASQAVARRLGMAPSGEVAHHGIPHTLWATPARGV